MLRVETNSKSVLLEVQQDLQAFHDKAEMALQRGVFGAVAMVSNRIKQNGTNTAGQAMQNKAGAGAYSPQYAKYRQQKGRQTNKVDLWLTGDLSNAFQVISTEPMEATAGFLNEREANKAGYLEEYYGEIWGLSDDEQTDVRELILDEIFN